MGSSHQTKDITPDRGKVSPGLILILAAQHVVVLFSGIILVPVMLVNIYGVNSDSAHYFIFATVFCAALGTLFQLFRGKHFGLGSPMFMGTSGAFLTCAHSALDMGGGALLAGMILVAAPFQIAFSYCIRFMRHILTPTVGGVIIMLAVVGLLRDAVATWTSPNHTQGWAAYMDIATGTATMAVMVLVEWFGRRKLRPWSLPLGILAGCGFAFAAGLPVMPDLSNSAWLGFPARHWPGITFSFSNPEHWTLMITFVLAILATSIKYTGDAMVLHKVVSPGKIKFNYDALQGGLYANSVSILISGLTCAMPSSSHSANIPLMKMTGVATRSVAAVASLLLITISLSPKMLQLLINLPQPVIGGVGVVLVGHLFSAGMQLVAEEMNHRNGLIAGLSLCAGLIAVRGDFFPLAFPHYMDPLTRNGVALGGLVAVVLTLMTRFSVERSVHISIRPALDNLPQLKHQLSVKSAQLKVTAAHATYLELACEEVFLYMCDEYQKMNFDGPINMAVRLVDGNVVVEASGGTRFTSEVDEIAARKAHCPETLDETELNELGLLLLGHIASRVDHITIAGYTYIEFVLPAKV